MINEEMAELSQWLDDNIPHSIQNAKTWGRLAKIGEEFGEVIEAYIGATGQNPRKGFTHTMDDVGKELLDTAATALLAYEHITGNRGESINAFIAHMIYLHKRAEIPSEWIKHELG